MHTLSFVQEHKNTDALQSLFEYNVSIFFKDSIGQDSIPVPRTRHRASGTAKSVLPSSTLTTLQFVSEDSDDEIEISNKYKRRRRRRSSCLDSSDEDEVNREDQPGNRVRRNFPRRKKTKVNYDETS